jgi:hypothetical protein
LSTDARGSQRPFVSFDTGDLSPYFCLNLKGYPLLSLKKMGCILPAIREILPFIPIRPRPKRLKKADDADNRTQLALRVQKIFNTLLKWRRSVQKAFVGAVLWSCFWLKH